MHGGRCERCSSHVPVRPVLGLWARMASDSLEGGPDGTASQVVEKALTIVDDAKSKMSDEEQSQYDKSQIKDLLDVSQEAERQRAKVYPLRCLGLTTRRPPPPPPIRTAAR